jgi:ABC-type Fe3+/spermidine/putrescine transport system ATPase subunit
LFFPQDPLSALDAHVGKAVFQNVLLNSPMGKTRILVTHALHFLPQVDYILTMVDGHIAERGTWAELMSSNGEFSKFVKEFGSKEETKDKEEVTKKDEVDGAPKTEKQKDVAAGAGIMQAEERAIGAVHRDVYIAYAKAGKGYIVLPLLLLSLALVQGATVMSSYWSVIRVVLFETGLC